MTGRTTKRRPRPQKSKLVCFRVTQEMYKQLDERAYPGTVSEFVRGVIEQKMVEEKQGR